MGLKMLGNIETTMEKSNSGPSSSFNQEKQMLCGGLF